MGGTNKSSNLLLWIGRMKCRLHAIMARIKEYMCITFAQLYHAFAVKSVHLALSTR